MRLSAINRAMRAVSSVRVDPEVIRMLGGVDYTTPPMQRKSGTLRDALNFEADQFGGYARIEGYERFDGQASPSDAGYTIIAATITGSPAVGDTLTGATSGATGVIIALPGSSFVMTQVSGTFQSGENLNVGGPTIAVATGDPIASSASTALLRAQYTNLAADVYRALIAAVPGSGAILGVVLYNDVVYAWRNNAGGTAAAIYKSSSSGWTAVALGEEISFSNANTSVGEGDVLTQGGVTATVKRVVVQTGTLASGTNTGRLIIYGRSGGNFAAGAATSTGGGSLTLSGAQSAITILPSGRYEFKKANFGGATGTKRVYGCDGVNRGFEFDGTDYGYVPIATGMTTDTPTHVTEHKKHLFFSFGSSAQHSGIGTPYVWTVVSGASELALGDDITGFSSQPGSESGGALMLHSRNHTKILYGSSTSDWNLVSYREELGAYAYTIQDVGYTMFLDDRGVTNFQTAQEFGNFSHAVLSNPVRNWLAGFRTSARASCISRDKSQYRLFFSNNYALYVTVVGKKVVGLMPVLFTDPVRCVTSDEMADGEEAIFFGSDDGYVYQMDKGTSFDGEAIDGWLYLSYLFEGLPRYNKRYRDVSVEVEGSFYAAFSVGYQLGYNSSDISQPDDVAVTSNFGGVQWDAFTWDNFNWDGQTLVPNTLTIDGEAENISLMITTGEDYIAAYKVTTAVLNCTPRKRLRG